MQREMPKHYENGSWRTIKAASVPASSIKNPCAVCGWSSHMAIHSVPAGTADPIGSIGLHSYVPVSAPKAKE
jgi:hypothetical protein